MSRMLKNKKGITLVTVIIVVTVLVILSAMLMQTVIYSLALTKRHKNVDYTYYAGESAIENWFSVITKVVNDPLIIDSYPKNVDITLGSSIQEYANYLITEVKDSGLLKNQYVDIAGVSPSSVPASTSATVSLALTDKIELVKAEYNATKKMIDISIGIKAEATFSTPDTPYNAGNKFVYSVKVFSVRSPVKGQLESAVWTVGDFYAKGNRVVVKGDVFTFGSFPNDIMTTNQEYYGGIFAINHGKLDIFGNAYTRSFIRTGPYFSTATDNSEIRIYRDSIAQCLQAFGNNDRIVALRNAYTFDDIEINGDDSVIAVNGSFFGLSTGGDVNAHDKSSAIVNSAIVHSAARDKKYADGSFRSRVVINGDFILGGTTFKVNAAGERIGEIEPASLAFNTDPLNYLPFYRMFEDSDFAGDPDKYHRELRTKFAESPLMLTGYLNQLQVWNQVSPYNSVDVDDWLEKIDIERNTTVGTYEKTVPPRIKGFAHYEAVANNRLYKNPLDGDPYTVYDYRTDLNVLSSYTLDNLFDGNNLKYTKNYWTGIDTGLNSDQVEEFLFGPSGLGGKCREIYLDLLGKVGKFIQRDYPTSGTATSWQLDDRIDEFHKILDSIDTKYSSLLDGNEATDVSLVLDDDDHMLYIGNDTTVSYTEDIDTLFNDSKTKDISVYDKSANRTGGGSDYFLIANADPDVNLKISGPFNGIIVTAGKIILEEGASIYGSIIAAGTGIYDGGVFYPRAEIVNSGNVGNLNNGDFAALKFVANPSSTEEPPYIDFYLGLSGDRNVYTEAGLKDVIAKAISTPEGSFLVPSSVTPSSEEYLGYLNKAARINLLNKFKDLGINLYDIF
ncbi:MAG: hypothetical protein BWY74_01658 [Firmicutes bacterium ADurb.Bin419]|nr:MAG: hypothetical protein BWY74_01658 [Firmicutes bacterium ADurb.Bin419]